LPAAPGQLKAPDRAGSRVEPRTRGGGDVLGHALDIGLRQLADGAGADEPGLLTRLVPDLPDAVLDCEAEGSDLR
jgi:hypothetical protein